MLHNVSNNAKSKLSQVLSLSDTVMNVEDAAVFPAAPFYLTVGDEVVEVTKVTGTSLDITRTAPVEHAVGTSVELRMMAEHIQELQTRVEEAFQSASSGKTKIAAAITGKGVITESTATFDAMAANIIALPSPDDPTLKYRVGDVLSSSQAISQVATPLWQYYGVQALSYTSTQRGLPLWEIDGYIYVATGTNIAKLDKNTGASTVLAHAGVNIAMSSVIDPVKKRWYTQTAAGSLACYSLNALSTNEIIWETKVQTGSFGKIAVSEDGNTLYVFKNTNSPSAVQIINADDGVLGDILPNTITFYTSAQPGYESMIKDGYLYIVYDYSSIAIYDMSTGGLVLKKSMSGAPYTIHEKDKKIYGFNTYSSDFGEWVFTPGTTPTFTFNISTKTSLPFSYGVYPYFVYSNGLYLGYNSSSTYASGIAYDVINKVKMCEISAFAQDYMYLRMIRDIDNPNIIYGANNLIYYLRKFDISKGLNFYKIIL